MLRTVHDRFPTVPVLAVAKEISLEDVRLGLEKMPDRFVEHPHTVLVVTNLSYADAPALLPSDPGAAARLNWQEVALEGSVRPRARRADRGARPAARVRMGDESRARRPETRFRSSRRCSCSTATTTSSCSTT